MAMGTNSSSKHGHGGDNVAQRKKKDVHVSEDVSQREQGVRHVLKGDAASAPRTCGRSSASSCS